MNAKVREFVTAELDAEMIPAIEKAEKDGAIWQYDPEYNGVAGLFSTAHETLLILYMNDRDAEVDERFFNRYM